MKDASHTLRLRDPRQHPPAGAGETAPPERKLVQLADLLGDAQGINIAYGEQIYRLQITKAGKLILTK